MGNSNSELDLAAEWTLFSLELERSSSGILQLLGRVGAELELILFSKSDLTPVDFMNC
jgi:hypothetical protein